MSKLAVVVAFAFAAACGSKAPATSTTSSASEPAPTKTASAGVPCTDEIALDCPNGVDGCVGGKTTVHVCVAADATPANSCTEENALVCPEGQIDACLQTPQSATNHICVMK